MTASERGRAWLDISLPALRCNVSELQRRLPPGCRLMAIVKADAYGHGAERISGELSRSGISSLAVAAIAEGIRLREHGITGDILVLGPTAAEDAPLLTHYRLAQLVSGPAHAKSLAETGCKLDVHIAVDTGMHRLGFDHARPGDIARVYEYGSFTVRGVATHLASSDSLDPAAAGFTNKQISSFYAVVAALRESGLDPGALHVAASYGVYNYPGLDCGFARVGIALYGVMSDNSQTLITPELRPILSLRARLADIREICAGEAVSYGGTFVADRPMRIAAVTVGYADGVPRQLSNTGAYMLVRGRRAPILGRVCMDLTVVDVTGIPDAAMGDIATVIGRDGAEEIRCEDFAEKCGTITNDILCRLGMRLPRLYIDA